MVVFWEPLSMGGSLSIILFEIFLVPSHCTYRFNLFFCKCESFSVMHQARSEGHKLSEPSFLFGLILFCFERAEA